MSNDLHKIHKEFCKALDSKSGWEAMEAAEKFQNKYPDKVFSASCDDNMFMGSDFYFIVNATDNEWMGVSGYYIPQSGDYGVPKFFLYPGHVESMLKALTKIKEAQDNHKGE